MPLEEINDAARNFATVWDAPERERIPRALLRALTAHSCLLLGAYDGPGRCVGAVLGWWGLDDPGNNLFLFSQKLGVLPEHRGTGVAQALKREQARLASERGVREVRWTFDPIRALNAAFNLRKLGAVGIGFTEDLYGPRQDRLNAGERTDRMLVSWRPLDAPRAGGTGKAGDDERRVRIPPDYAGYQQLPAPERHVLRDRLRDQLRAAFDDGYLACGFEHPGDYILRKAVA